MPTTANASWPARRPWPRSAGWSACTTSARTAPYHRQAVGRQLPLPARLLAAADVWQALGQPRPHRPALAPERAAAEHVYTKLGMSTRAAAALFAMEHGLLPDPGSGEAKMG
jgi:hypothetical protein